MISIVNFDVHGESPRYRVGVRVDFKNGALEGLSWKSRESDFSWKAQLDGMNFLFRNLGSHQDGIDCSKFHHNLIVVRDLIRIHQPLEHDAVNRRFHPYALKRDLRLA